MRSALLLMSIPWAFASGCGGTASPTGPTSPPDGGAVADHRVPPAPEAGTDSAKPSPEAACPASIHVGCDGGACPALMLENDPPGAPHLQYADPTIYHDPVVANRHWLAYSHLDSQSITLPDGGTVNEATVSTHLARSDNGGASFDYVAPLWPAQKTTDPNGGATTYRSSEVASLVAVENGGQVTWYGEHLRYMLLPEAGYNPDFKGSWVIAVGSAVSSTPTGLAGVEESVLGRSTVDASAWGVTTVLDDVSPAGAVSDCYFFNNPAITFQNGKLYLAAECWVAGMGGGQDVTKARILLYSTTAMGPAHAWTWQYVGVLADHAMAQELGGQTLDVPDFSYALDGTPLVILSPTMLGGLTGQTELGCVALAMSSLDPPTYAKGCDGGLDIRAVARGVGACTHDPTSVRGIIGVYHGGTGDDLSLITTGLRP